MSKHFQENKQAFKAAFKKVLANGSNEQLNEAAFPAYAHSNCLIDHLFWSRLKVVEDFVLQSLPSGKLLDFGCGSGFMSQLMQQHGFQVTAMDLCLQSMAKLQPYIDFDPGIEFIESNLLSESNLDDKYDIILALDVLEHIQDITSYLKKFATLLSDQGKLIVCGPTENLWYRLGRQLAGNHFQGHYHVSNINIIKSDTEKVFSVIQSKRLYFPMVLFEVFVAQPAKPVG